jgi:hypothetical protein
MPTIDTVLGTDTPNTGRTKWNANDAALKTEVEAATADLATHKGASNTDHDAHNDDRYSALGHTHDDRYYTETETDAFAVKLTGDQTIAGVKTLTSDLIVKKASAAVELQNASGARVGRFISRQPTAGNEVALQVYDEANTQFIDVLSANMGTREVKNMAGEVLATLSQVQERIRSGFFTLTFSRHVASLADGTTYYVLDANSTALLVPIPAGAVLKAVTYNYRLTGGAIGDDQTRNVASIAFTPSGYKWLYLRFVHSNATRSLALSVGAGKWVSGSESIDWTAIDDISNDAFQTGQPVTVYIGLEFSR